MSSDRIIEMAGVRFVLSILVLASFGSTTICAQSLVEGHNYFDLGSNQAASNIGQVPTVHFEPQIEMPNFNEPETQSAAGKQSMSNFDSQLYYEFDSARNPMMTTGSHSLIGLPFRARIGRFGSELQSDFVDDFHNYYRVENFRQLLGVFAVGAAVANTSTDAWLEREIVEGFHSKSPGGVSRILHDVGKLGDGYRVLPAYVVIALVGKGLSNNPDAYVVGEWSEQTFRGMVAGVPTLILAQNLTGASRPGETDHASGWRPFNDDNGVSGHAFVGAVPFLTAAKMSNNKWAKIGFYTASVLPALSRVTDERHYPSQAILGWTLAYVATSAVAKTESGSRNVEFGPMIIGRDLGFGVTLRH